MHGSIGGRAARRIATRPVGAVAVAVALLVTTGCASTGSTYRSGVGDRFLAESPYYAGARVAGPAERGRTIAHAPIGYQRGGSHAAIFDPEDGDGSAVGALLAEMNAFLDSLGATRALALAQDVGSAGDAATLPGTPPDVHFGCETGLGGECSNGPAAEFEWGKPRMRLAVGRPSREWIDAAAGALAASGAEHLLVITLEVGQYWPRQTNWRGSKAVELGTGFTLDLPWLTSLETPVTVLQLTGALVDARGLAVRIGAEGMLARRTGIVAAGLGFQEVIREDDVAELRAARRGDAVGNPSVWQTALRNLVAGLTGSPGLAAR